jgi:Lar family restriction alleviation protein
MDKPCPFGGHADIQVMNFFTWFAMVCNECGANRPMADTEEEAGTLWNERAQ